ncbi:MAG: SMC-Scp complex subunit ScpB [Bacteroidia bacterium]|nr:SMC-Scp complex subunit ScpB [Bacteroidia bacterium]
MEPTLSQIIEAVIFVADQPVTWGFIRNTFFAKKAESADNGTPVEDDAEEEPWDAGEFSLFQELTEEVWEEIVKGLQEKYSEEKYPFEIRKVGGGCQFFTKPAFHRYVRKASLNKNQKRLSRAALETLSIIAYRQPISKAEMEFIRGVNCDYAVQKLLEKKLVAITGRSEGPGRPLLYSTSAFFMQYFGLADMSDLPKLKEFEELAEEHQELFRQQMDDKINKPNGKETGENPEEGSLLEE